MPQEFHNQLERLRQQFAANLPERARRLEEIWSHLRHLNWSEQGITTLQQFAHKLIEAGTSVGFPELRHAAQQLENFITDLNELGRSFGGLEYAQLEDHIKLLGAAALRARLGLPAGARYVLYVGSSPNIARSSASPSASPCSRLR